MSYADAISRLLRHMQESVAANDHGQYSHHTAATQHAGANTSHKVQIVLT